MREREREREGGVDGMEGRGGGVATSQRESGKGGRSVGEAGNIGVWRRTGGGFALACSSAPSRCP